MANDTVYRQGAQLQEPLLEENYPIIVIARDRKNTDPETNTIASTVVSGDQARLMFESTYSAEALHHGQIASFTYYVALPAN